MKPIEFIKDNERRSNALATIVIAVLIAITAVMFGIVFRAQNIGVKQSEFDGTTIEEVFNNPSDIDDENITKAFWNYQSFFPRMPTKMSIRKSPACHAGRRLFTNTV